jgi:uncharacterized oligopeptide transporter (OPT) family protein
MSFISVAPSEQIYLTVVRYIGAQAVHAWKFLSILEESEAAKGKERKRFINVLNDFTRRKIRKKRTERTSVEKYD